MLAEFLTQILFIPTFFYADQYQQLVVMSIDKLEENM